MKTTTKNQLNYKKLEIIMIKDNFVLNYKINSYDSGKS